MKNKKITLSHDEIQNALRAFKKNGGLIKLLPDEVAIGQTLVGGKWSIYETGDDIVSTETEVGRLN